MSANLPVVSEVAHHMALVPLLWLGVLAYYGQRRGVTWWMLAMVLGISWAADSAAHAFDPWLVSALYPAFQAAVCAAVLVSSPAFWDVLALLVTTALFPLWMRGTAHPDMISHTVAWTTLVAIVWPQRALRVPVLVTFGLGGLGWLVYSFSPSWGTWGTFQGIRAIGIGTFCWATAPSRVRA